MLNASGSRLSMANECVSMNEILKILGVTSFFGAEY